MAGEAGAVEVSVGAGMAEVSTLKSRLATVWLPAPSVARTRNVWGPSASGAEGESEPTPEQGAKSGEPESIEHSSVAPASEWKLKTGCGLAVSPDGPLSIASAGGVASTRQVSEAGLGSVLAARSVALTSKVWLPSARES